MTDETITIEVDGKELTVKPGSMLIEATDAAGIYVPRFCYHEKLTVAANCRMCLVEVEKAPKPLPACATPVAQGMKVFTRSEYARSAQKSVMEFLLINHPLDCPICDQGGECELQDLAMGYGRDVSRYQEQKRVVFDKNIGPLVATEMTRCIQCTRCVRFGEEIAGVRELGATGRGESMEIGTFIEKSLVSELSGNIIDICPVGALTSKPYRFTARAWEITQRASIAPHDSVGSNLYLHVKGSEVKRAVPKDNEAINEAWISDRDRFGYIGLSADDRLTMPMVKKDGKWLETDWETALDVAAKGLTEVINEAGAHQIGALASPTATLEELFLFQRFARGLGSTNIDHRLRQGDFSGQDSAPLFPWLGQGIAELEKLDAALLVGSNLRKDHPMINHRLRKAALAGGKVMAINPVEYEFNYNLAEAITVAPDAMAAELGCVARVLAGTDAALDKLVGDITPTATHKAIAENLKSASNATVLLGNLATGQANYSLLCYLASKIATLAGCGLGYLGESANSAGAWLAGVVPHRCPAGEAVEKVGFDARSMFTEGLDAYVLMGVEPELESWDSAAAKKSLAAAKFVLSLTAFRTPAIEADADVMLPIALFAETSGTFVNVEGQWQSFSGAVAPPGQARPAWKILRVLGNLFDLGGFEYESSGDVFAEIQAHCEGKSPDNSVPVIAPARSQSSNGNLQRIGETPIYSVDALVRRSAPLQKTADGSDGLARLNTKTADRLGIAASTRVRVSQGGDAAILPLAIDERVPDDCALIQAGHYSSAGLGPCFGSIEVVPSD